MTDGALPPLFPLDDIPVIVQDVLDCCQSLRRPNPRSKRPEEEISKQVFLRLTRIGRYRTGPLEPHMESWLPDAAHRGDIRFSCGRGIETYFLFEAKRLFVTFPKAGKRSLIPEYIHEGMMRFVGRHYAPWQHQSAMLGYVHDESLPVALERLGAAISGQAQCLKLNRPLATSALAVTPSVHETEHALEDGPFILYHLLVAIPANQPTSQSS